MTDKINLYINSSYRKKDETTSNLKCIVPSGLIKSYGKDYLTLSITSFYRFNTFYQMDETNNEFSLIIRNSIIYTNYYYLASIIVLVILMSIMF
jgi:hypothetical protein